MALQSENANVKPLGGGLVFYDQGNMIDGINLYTHSSRDAQIELDSTSFRISHWKRTPRSMHRRLVILSIVILHWVGQLFFRPTVLATQLELLTYALKIELSRGRKAFGIDQH